MRVSVFLIKILLFAIVFETGFAVKKHHNTTRSSSASTIKPSVIRKQRSTESPKLSRISTTKKPPKSTSRQSSSRSEVKVNSPGGSRESKELKMRKGSAAKVKVDLSDLNVPVSSFTTPLIPVIISKNSVASESGQNESSLNPMGNQTYSPTSTSSSSSSSHPPMSNKFNLTFGSQHNMNETKKDFEMFTEKKSMDDVTPGVSYLHPFPHIPNHHPLNDTMMIDTFDATDGRRTERKWEKCFIDGDLSCESLNKRLFCYGEGEIDCSLRPKATSGANGRGSSAGGKFSSSTPVSICSLPHATLRCNEPLYVTNCRGKGYCRPRVKKEHTSLASGFLGPLNSTETVIITTFITIGAFVLIAVLTLIYYFSYRKQKISPSLPSSSASSCHSRKQENISLQRMQPTITTIKI